MVGAAQGRSAKSCHETVASTFPWSLFETVVQIMRRPRTRDVPIILFTAQGQNSAQVFRGYDVGAADFLAKPFDPWLLRAKVSVFLDLHCKNLRLAELTATVERLGGG